MRTFFITLLVVASQATTGQNLVYFPGFELINVPDNGELQYSTSKLIKAYVEDNHAYTLILDKNVSTVGYNVDEDQSQSAKSALEINARFFMRGEIYYLQGKYIVSLGVYESKTNERVWHDMVKGAVEQDLDPLLSRLGRSFLTNNRINIQHPIPIAKPNTWIKEFNLCLPKFRKAIFR